MVSARPLGSPLGKLKSLPSAHLSARELYRGNGFDVFATVDKGLAHTRECLTLLGGMIRRNTWTARSKSRFLELCPEGAPAHVVKAA